MNDETTLRITYRVTDDTSPKADLADSKHDDGVFQLILLFGYVSEGVSHITHVLLVTHRSSEVEAPKLGRKDSLAAVPMNPSGKIDNLNKEYGGVINVEGFRPLTEGKADYHISKDPRQRARFIELEANFDKMEEVDINLSELVDSVFYESRDEITDLLFIGMEGTSKNCKDDKTACVEIYGIDIIE